MDIPLVPIDGGHLDLVRGQVTRDGQTQSLTSIEVAVLSVLCDAMPEPVSEEQLLRRAWGYKTTKTRTVSMGISRLRAKIEREPKAPQVVLTVRGKGYRLVAQEAAEPPPASPPRPVLGRDELLEKIAAWLAEDRRVVEVVGPGGVGTTAVARAASPHAPVVDLRGVQRREGLVRRLVDSLGLEGPEGVALVRQALGDRGAVVLDAVEGLDDEAVSLLRELVAGAPGPILMTSRRPVGIGPRVMVRPLDRASARQLLQRAREDAGLPPVTDEQAAPVLADAGGFPLGLVLAAPLVELATEGPLGLSTDGELGRVLRETLSLCSDDERRLLAQASAFAVPPALGTLVELAGGARAMVLRALHGLRERGLVRLAEGVVDVPAAVASVAITAPAQRAHVAWVAARTADPIVLRPLRHEIEAALATATPELLPEVAIRHLQVLSVFGPHERLDEEITALLPRVTSPGRRQVLLGGVLQVAGERTAARDAFEQARRLLPDDDRVFHAWAALSQCVLATWLRRFDVAEAMAPELLELRGSAGDRALWAALTINAASLVAVTDPDRAAELFRQVDAHADEVPSLSLLAMFHRLGIDAPHTATVRYGEKLLARVGPEQLGRRWAGYNLRIGRAWLRAGDESRGLALLRAHRDEALRVAASDAENVLAMTVVNVLHQPALAREVLALLPTADGPVARLARWYLDGTDGPPPTEHPELAAVWAAVRRGEPATIVRPWVSLTRSLQHMQAAAKNGPAPATRDGA